MCFKYTFMMNMARVDSNLRVWIRSWRARVDSIHFSRVDSNHRPEKGKPQQLVDRNCFSLWHIMSNRKHAMWNKKHAMWNTKHVICKHIPYFEKWPNVSWMEPSLRNLTEPNVSWMEPSLRNLSEPNVSWMEPWLPNVSWMEPSLRNLSEPNVSWMEPSLRNLSEPNVSWTEPSLRNLSEPNVSWMEPSLRNLSKPNISWMEPGLRNLSEPNVSWMEPWLPNVSWMEPSLRNLSEPNVSWMEPGLRNLSEPNVSWMEPGLRNLSEPNVSWMEPSLRNRFHSFGTSRNLVQGFGRLPQTTPKLYWKNPQPFRLLGKKKRFSTSKTSKSPLGSLINQTENPRRPGALRTCGSRAPERPISRSSHGLQRRAVGGSKRFCCSAFGGFLSYLGRDFCWGLRFSFFLEIFWMFFLTVSQSGR